MLKACFLLFEKAKETLLSIRVTCERVLRDEVLVCVAIQITLSRIYAKHALPTRYLV